MEGETKSKGLAADTNSFAVCYASVGNFIENEEDGS
jgi:hypothetical protein